MIKVDGSVAIISIKNFPIGLQVMYLYLPDRPRSFIYALWRLRASLRRLSQNSKPNLT
jgi:hypothetical protein